jgi:hypothetical protein
MLLKSINYLSLVSIIFSCINCSDSLTEKVKEQNAINYSEIKKANWLIGSWQNISENEISTEIWEKKNDSLFTAKSFVIVKHDTVFEETISVEQKGNTVYYIPKVKDQNGGKAVEFLLAASNEDQLVFENLKHDFPQKISYTKIAHDSILAEISGIEEGKQKSILFPFTRKK